MNICHLIHEELPPIHQSTTAVPLPKLEQLFKPSPSMSLTSILAVDSITGHVLARMSDGAIEWIPYLYLRWGCSAFTNKRWLDKAMLDLKSMSIPMWLHALPRHPITKFHKIVPLFYIPRLDDGTLQGCYEHIVYRLWGKSKIGVTTLGLIQSPELAAFVACKQLEIKKAAGSQALLNQTMGLNVSHNDLMLQPWGSLVERKVRRKLATASSPNTAE